MLELLNSDGLAEEERHEKCDRNAKVPPHDFGEVIESATARGEAGDKSYALLVSYS